MSTVLAPSNESLERIIDAHWNGGGDGVEFSDIHQHNACNHTLSGTIDIEGHRVGFIIDSGDLAGTVVRAWGDPEEVGVYQPPPPPESFTFIPSDPYLHERRPEMFQLYIYWRKQQWFKDKVAAYLYDRHFQPGAAVERPYRAWAEAKGLRIGLLSDLPKEARKLIAKGEELP